jgi:hypothetical protein
LHTEKNCDCKLSRNLSPEDPHFATRNVDIRRQIYRKNFTSQAADALLLLLREAWFMFTNPNGHAGSLSIPDFTMYLAPVAAFAQWFKQWSNNYVTFGHRIITSMTFVTSRNNETVRMIKKNSLTGSPLLH